jgi:hypothetical protein
MSANEEERREMNKSSKEKKERLLEIFYDVHAVAFGKSDKVMRDALDTYLVEFEDLIKPKKREKTGGKEWVMEN